MKIISAFYNPVAFYPPTQYALRLLTNAGHEVISISTGTFDKETFLNKLVLLKTVPYKTWKIPHISTFIHFIAYCLKLRNLILEQNPNILLLYDPPAVLAWTFIRNFIRNEPILWYHNHDVIEATKMSRFSLQRLSLNAQLKIFPNLSIFTLPSAERLNYFPMKQFKGEYFHLPNYPSIEIYRPFQKKPNKLPPNGVIKLIYQGRVSDGHGLLELIDFVSSKSKYSLTIIGPPDSNFKKLLHDRIQEKKCAQKVYLYPQVIYDELLAISSKHDVGIATNLPIGIIYKTGGTASNKLYEYAALGMPTIYYDEPHYNEYLEEFDWAFKTDLSDESLTNCLNDIANNYSDLSKKALGDFENTFNYENNMIHVLKHLSKFKS